MENGSGTRAWPQVAGVGGASAELYWSVCLTHTPITSLSWSLRHHLALIIISSSRSPPKVGLIN